MMGTIMGQKEDYILKFSDSLYCFWKKHYGFFQNALFYELYIYYVALSLTETQCVLGIMLSCPSLTVISLYPHNNPEGKNTW